LVDPWRDCERIYDDHFMDRMRARSLPAEQVREALKDGKKVMEKKNEYSIRWNDWTIKASVQTCFVYLRTAFIS